MKIYKEILDSILHNMPIIPPEVGGIIGGINKQVSIWEYDEGYGDRGCVYRPNVEYLNRIIAEWHKKKYEFMGILHVHFGGARKLSEGDIKYIEDILKAMPETINELYFPVVVQPETEMVVYIARISLEGQVEIELDELEII